MKQVLNGVLLSEMLSILSYMKQLTKKPKYFLLDEWDANLDQENKKKADKTIDSLAQENVILEVRHT